MTAECCPNCGWDLDDEKPMNDDEGACCDVCGYMTEFEYLVDGVCLSCAQCP